MALTLSGTGVVGVIAPSLLNFLIERDDWRAAYNTMGVFALLALIPIAFFFRESREPGTNNAVSTNAAAAAGLSVREAASKRVFWQIAVAIAGALGLAVIFGRLLTGFLVDRFYPPYVAAGSEVDLGPLLVATLGASRLAGTKLQAA